MTENRESKRMSNQVNTDATTVQEATPIYQWTCRRMANMVQGADGKWRIVPGTKYLSLTRHRQKYRADQCADCPAFIPAHGNRKYCVGCRERRYQEHNAAAKDRMTARRAVLNEARDANYRKMGRPVPETGKRGRPKGARDLGRRKGSIGYRPEIDGRRENLRGW